MNSTLIKVGAAIRERESHAVPLPGRFNREMAERRMVEALEAAVAMQEKFLEQLHLMDQRLTKIENGNITAEDAQIAEVQS